MLTHISSWPEVQRESELRPSTGTETLWMTLSSTAALEIWAVGCSTCATLPPPQLPPPSPSRKWSQMRWRAASRCRHSWRRDETAKEKSCGNSSQSHKFNFTSYLAFNFDFLFYDISLWSAKTDYKICLPAHPLHKPTSSSARTSGNKMYQQ